MQLVSVGGRKEGIARFRRIEIPRGVSVDGKCIVTEVGVFREGIDQWGAVFASDPALLPSRERSGKKNDFSEC